VFVFQIFFSPVALFPSKRPEHPFIRDFRGVGGSDMAKRAKIGSDEDIPRTIKDNYAGFSDASYSAEPLRDSVAKLTTLDKDVDTIWTTKQSLKDAFEYLTDLRKVTDLAMDNTTNAHVGLHAGSHLPDSTFPAPYMFETRRVQRGNTGILPQIAAIATGNDHAPMTNAIVSASRANVVDRLRSYTRMRLNHPELFKTVLSDSQNARLASLEYKWYNAAAEYRENPAPTESAQKALLDLFTQLIDNSSAILTQIKAEQSTSTTQELDTWANIVNSEVADLKSARDRTMNTGAASGSSLTRMMSAVSGLPGVRQVVSLLSTRAEPIPVTDKNYLRALSRWGYVGLTWPEAFDLWDRGLVGNGPISDPGADLALYSEVLVRVYESIFVRTFNTLSDVCYARVIKRVFDKAMTPATIDGDDTSSAALDKRVLDAINALYPILEQASTLGPGGGDVVVVADDAQSRLRAIGASPVDVNAQISFEETMVIGCIGDMTGMATHRSGMSEYQERRDPAVALAEQFVVTSYMHRDRTLARATRGSLWDRLNCENPAYCSKIDPRDYRVFSAYSGFDGIAGEQRHDDNDEISVHVLQNMRRVQAELFKFASLSDPVYPTYTERMGVANLSKWISELEQYSIRRATDVFVVADTERTRPVVKGKPIDAANLMQELHREDALRKYIRRAHRIVQLGRELDERRGFRPGGPGAISDFITEAAKAHTTLAKALESTSKLVYDILKENAGVKGDIKDILRTKIKGGSDEYKLAESAIGAIRGLELKWELAYRYCVDKASESMLVLRENLDAAQTDYKQKQVLETEALLAHETASKNGEPNERLLALASKAEPLVKARKTALNARNEARRRYKSGLNGDVRLCAAMARAATMWGIEPYLVAPTDRGDQANQAIVQVIRSSGLSLIQRTATARVEGDVQYVYIPYGACQIEDPVEFIINSVLVPSQTTIGVRYSLSPDENATRAYMESFRAKLNLLRATANKLTFAKPKLDSIAVGASVMVAASTLLTATGFVSASEVVDSLPTDASLASRSARTCAIAILRIAGTPVEQLGQIGGLDVDASSLPSMSFFGASVAKLYARTDLAVRRARYAEAVAAPGSISIPPVLSGVTVPLVSLPLIANTLRMAARAGYTLPVAVARNGVVCALLGATDSVTDAAGDQPTTAKPLVLHAVGVTLGAVIAIASGGYDWIVVASVSLGATLALRTLDAISSMGGLGDPANRTLQQQVENAIPAARQGGGGSGGQAGRVPTADDLAIKSRFMQLLDSVAVYIPGARTVAEWLFSGAVEFVNIARKYPVLTVAIALIAVSSALNVAQSTSIIVNSVIHITAPSLWAARDVAKRAAVAGLAQLIAGIAVKHSRDLEGTEDSSSFEYAFTAVMTGLATSGAFVVAAHVDNTLGVL
jgi:hypothetical protein